MGTKYVNGSPNMGVHNMYLSQWCYLAKKIRPKSSKYLNKNVCLRANLRLTFGKLLSIREIFINIGPANLAKSLQH
jgi:hypothetical protein